MLVTLTNTGAAVVRAEMVESSLSRDQEDWSGYLGRPGIEECAGRSAGTGRPALALRRQTRKIEAGDLIVGRWESANERDQKRPPI